MRITDLPTVDQRTAITTPEAALSLLGEQGFDTTDWSTDDVKIAQLLMDGVDSFSFTPAEWKRAGQLGMAG